MVIGDHGGVATNVQGVVESGEGGVDKGEGVSV